jgi:hypothetical protein
MSQRRRSSSSRRRRPSLLRRFRKRLGEFVALATIVGVAIAFLSFRHDSQATDREHESRQAKEAIRNYEELDKSAGRWVTGAKFVYRASLKTFKKTGRWPRGEDDDTYEAVIDASTDVRRLQAGMSDRQLVKLLNALRSDIGELCATTSVRTAYRASHSMMDHSDNVSARISVLKYSANKRLQMIG